MTNSFILAFFITPAVVSVLGVAAVLLHKWAERREDRRNAERR